MELSESNRDVQLDRLTTGIKALISENQQLRELLSSVAGFIGTGSGGMGGVLSSIGGIDSQGASNPRCPLSCYSSNDIHDAEFGALISRHENDRIAEALKERPNASGTTRQPTAGPSTSKRQKHSAGISSNLQMDMSVDPLTATYSPPTYRLPPQPTSRPPSQAASPVVNLFSPSVDMGTSTASQDLDRAAASTSDLAKACSVVEGEVMGGIRGRIEAGEIQGHLQHIQAHEDNIQELFSRVRFLTHAPFLGPR